MCAKCEMCSDVVEILTINGYCLECEDVHQQSLKDHDAMLDEMYEAYIASFHDHEPDQGYLTSDGYITLVDNGQDPF